MIAPDPAAELGVRRHLSGGSCGDSRIEQIGEHMPKSEMELRPGLVVIGEHMAKSEMQLRPGIEVIRGYVLVSWLGSGGFGEVWQAVAPDDSPCALKFIDLRREAVAARESRALHFMKALRHPHVLSIRDVFSIEHSLVVCMELGHGTLRDRLNECQRQGLTAIPAIEAVALLTQAAEGIDFLNAPSHLVDGAQGVRIIHQDIKPQNLLLVGGLVKVADFGLARVIEESLAEKSTSSLTPAYAPPEFFRGETAEQSDQYSLAACYCLLRGGRLPFTGTFYQLMAGHTSGTPDLTMLPETERSAVARALSKQRQERWPNCSAFVENLRRSLTPEQSCEHQPDPAWSATTIDHVPRDN
jgi:serine/threonine protein kinase